MAADDKKILVECADIDDVGSYLCVNMLGFQELARDTSLERHGLKAVVSINEFFEQRTEKAYNMIKLSTIELYSQHPATANDKATLLGLKGLYFMLEPYRNKNLTNPFWAVEMVSRGFHIWNIQRQYVQDVVKAQMARAGRSFTTHDYTLSYQVHEQFLSLAQGLVNWFLTWHRHRNGHSKWKWAKCHVHRINEDKQEDLHRRVRFQTRSNNVNATMGEFLDFLQRALQSDDSEMWLCANSMATDDFPTGTCQTSGLSSLGLWVEPGESHEEATRKLSFKSDVPSESYDEFAAKLATKWEAGFMWARGEWERDFPVAVQQFQAERMWNHSASGLPVFADYSKDRPAGMVIASGHVSTTKLPGAVIGTVHKSIMSKQARKALKQVEAAIQKERALVTSEAGAVQADGPDDPDALGLVARVYELAEESRRQLVANWADNTKLAIKKEKVGANKMQLQLLLDAAVLEGKNGDMWHTDKVLSREFRKDIVNVGRDRRFWVTRLRKWRMAMLDGHDTIPMAMWDLNDWPIRQNA